MPTHRKHRYPPLLIGFFALVAAAGLFFSPPFWLVALIAICLFGASWLTRRKYALFFRGMYLLNQQKFEEAEAVFQAFLEKIRQRPDMKKGAKLWYYGAYTPDFEAMALNNLGVAKMAQEQNIEATRYFEQALSIDTTYAKPHHNLAILAAADGDKISAQEHFQKAVDLGYDGGSFDQFLEKIRDEYAKTFN